MIKRYGEAALRGDIRAAATLLKIRAEFSRENAMEPNLLYMTKEDMMAA
jgi:hypothetical protein